MSDAALANQRASSELPFAEVTNDNAVDGLSGVKVKNEPMGDSYHGDDEVKVKDENMKAKVESKDQKDGVPVKLKRKGRRGRSSGTLTMKGDKITSFTTERGVTYAPNDHVYIENNRPNQPYFICSIQDFSVTRKDTLVVQVKWYYRVSEVPDTIYQHLVQDRYDVYDENEVKLKEPEVRSRELFHSEATDTYPVTALRGKCKVSHCASFEAARSFQPAQDSFYYILGYNPETKRLATTQGQIRVGSMYQARMPECKPHVAPKDMPESSEDLEVLGWQPQSVLDGDLMMYLRAARSIAAFAGMCDGGSTEEGCQAASMDITTISAMHMLHRFKYDTGRALQALVKAPALKTIDKKWHEEDTKRFVKGLRLYGKNFFKIRKELLSHRETSELVEYYYFWKKTPQAAANRPHRRHRKHGVKRATTRSQRPASSEFLDVSSASECSDNDSDDSDSRDLGSYRCQNCFITLSKDWSNAEKPSPRLCTKCRIYFKKYGEDRPLDGDFPYFQPVKDDDAPNGTTMLTRQRNSTDSKDNKKKDNNSISSLDNLDSPLSDSKKSLGLSSPSALSTCSNSSTDREKKKRRAISSSPSKNHNHIASDPKRQRQNRSDSDSVSDSSDVSGNEENGNEGDIETNQDELSSSSPPSTPCPSDFDDKQGKTTPVPTPVESTIKDKLNQLPRPEPQHPQPSGLPIVSSPVPTLPPSLPGLPSQGFGSLPPLPAFAFRPQCPYPGPLYPPQPPLIPDSLPQKQSLSEDDRKSVSPHGERTNVGAIATDAKVKEEVVTPPTSPRRMQIKQEPGINENVICENERTANQSNLGHGNQSNLGHVGENYSGQRGESYPHKGPFGSVIQRDSYEKMTQKPQFDPMNPRQPFESLVPRNPADPVSQRDSYDLMSQRPPYSLVTQRDQFDSVNQRGRYDLVTQKDQFESFGQAKTFGPETQKEPFDLVTPKLEPVQSNSVSVSESATTSQTETDTMKSSVTSQAEVKVESEGQGHAEQPDVVIMEEDSESDREGTLTPGPVPTPCNKEIHRSKSAVFIKLLNRGEHNSCTRCDLVFKPLPDSKLARKREEREKRGIPATTPIKDEREKRKAESPPPNSTADAQIVSNIPPPHHTHQDRVTPRSYQDTPALRQLSEYAKPHAMGQDPRAIGGYPLGLSPFMDPVRMAAMFPPNSRERLELELERDKRERDARERELREHELRNMEMREKLKAELEMKPPGFERLLPPGANPLESHWLEIQRRYGHPMVHGAAGGSHIPGIYPPTSIASDLMARERDRLERLGLPPPSPQLMMGGDSYTAAIMERLSAERMSAERLNVERLQAERLAFAQDPMVRLQLTGLPGAAAAAAAAASSAQQAAHTHTHAHSHTHLHLHQPDGGPPPPGPPGLHPILPPHLLPPGADPMSGVSGSNPPGAPPGGSAHGLSLPLGMGMPPHHLLASREQEMIQNDLYRRACTDPALAQQLQAHHEALQRMALERERFGAGHLPPPH